MHVKAKDEVLVVSGKDKGKRGRVLSVNEETGRVLVERVNMVKKHSKANPRKGVQGGIIEKEAPIDASNVMLVCGKCGPTRPRRVRRDGNLQRSCRKCGTAVGE